MKIHREGLPTLLVGIGFLALVYLAVHSFLPYLIPFFWVVAVIFYVFLISFFRVPERQKRTVDAREFLSPADGKVVVIERVMEDEYFRKECTMVSVFMSPLNVHINFYPMDGKTILSKHHHGKYLAAWNPKASTENERSTIVLETAYGPVLMRQVAGALARRIVTYAKAGEQGVRGEEMGFIKFGSRVDVYFPDDVDISVTLDQKVTGGQTVLATMR